MKTSNTFLSLCLGTFVLVHPFGNTADAKDLDAMNNAKDCVANWMDVNAKKESSHSYNARNGNAVGKYQIMIGNFISSGYVEKGAKNWDEAVFTDLARAKGVNSLNDVLNKTAGHDMQEEFARGLLTKKYQEVASTAKNLNGKTVMTASGQKTLNDAMVMRGTWWLGSGNYKYWAENGFSGAALEKIDRERFGGQILNKHCWGDKDAAGNCLKSYHKLAQEQTQTWDAFANTDLSCLTNSPFVNGSFVEGGDYNACDEDIGNHLAQVGQKHVENTVMAAQDEKLGISQSEESYDMMSCVDFAFKGSFDALFNVPDFGSIAGILKDGISIDGDALSKFACKMVQDMTGKAMNQVTGALTDMTGEMTAGFGPLSSLGGVSVGFNPNGEVGQNNIGIQKVPLDDQFNNLFSGVNNQFGGNVIQRGGSRPITSNDVIMPIQIDNSTSFGDVANNVKDGVTRTYRDISKTFSK